MPDVAIVWVISFSISWFIATFLNIADYYNGDFDSLGVAIMGYLILAFVGPVGAILMIAFICSGHGRFFWSEVVKLCSGRKKKEE